MDIIEELKEIITRIDKGETLGTYEAGMIEIVVDRLERIQTDRHPEQPVKSINNLFPGRQVVTAGPDGEGLVPLYAVANTSVTRSGKSCELAELCFDLENPL